MPKKRASTYDTKPSSPAHPSLSSSKSKDASHSLISSGASDGNSVNDQIQKLRLSERRSSSSAGHPTSSELFNPTSNPSLPPSLRHLLRIPDAPPPRPRPGLRVTRGRRIPAGPAAPQSWLRRSPAESYVHRSKLPTYRASEATKSTRLPGAYIPEDGSLLATTLKAIARDWDWHSSYDQYYLATLPVRYKEALLRYIVEYYEHGIDRKSLELIFQDDSELEDGTGAEGLAHLDLTTSIGSPLKLSELKALLDKKRTPTHSDESAASPPESWDDSEHPISGPSPPRFDTLTHLSLAHPAPTARWKSLLDLAPHLTTLTHLSLAYWPTPTLSPNSRTAYRETPQGNVQYGASDFYHELDQDRSEATSILRRFSRSTYCLQWLDLTGCFPWVLAIGDLDAEWRGAWWALETVKAGQRWLPRCFWPGADESDWRRLYKDQEAWHRLIGWALSERDLFRLEERVNQKIGLGIRGRENVDEEMARVVRRPRPDMNTHWEDAEAAAEVDNHSLKGGEVARGRLVIEHGWDAWWIKKAIDELAPPRSKHRLGVP